MSGDCPRCGEHLHDAEPDVGIMTPGCPGCGWHEGIEDVADASEIERDEFVFDHETDIEPEPAYETEAEQVGDPGFAFGGPR